MVQRNIGDQLPAHGNHLFIRVQEEVGDPGDRGMEHGPPDLLLGHVLEGHGLQELRGGHGHESRPLPHDVKVSHGGRVGGARVARTHHQGDLGDDAGSQSRGLVQGGRAPDGHPPAQDGPEPRPAEDVVDPLPAGIDQLDVGDSMLHGHLHDPGDLVVKPHAERPAQDGQVLADHVHRPPVDLGEAGDDGVPRKLPLVHVKARLQGTDPQIQFLKGPGVHQLFHPLPGGQLPRLVLAVDGFRASHLQEPFPLLFNFLNFFQHRMLLMSFCHRCQRGLTASRGNPL